jgi:transcriptional regulator with XRE-family HTH domain
VFTTGDRLRHYRRRAGLTQHELARASGVHQTTIARIELDRYRKAPNLDTLRKLAALEVDPRELIAED